MGPAARDMSGLCTSLLPAVLLPAVALLAAGLLASGAAGAETRFSDSVVVSQAINDDLYAAAGEVRISGAIGGAAILAAGTAEISGDVEGDVILGGGRIDLAGGVGDDLRAAGGDVQVSGFVTDQAAIVGGTVTIGPGSAIGGRTWIAAGDAEIAGQIGDDLRVFAGTVVISGQVAGNVEVTAREIRVAPDAVIGGNLLWRSNQPPVIAEEAQIFGDVRAAGGGEMQSLVDESSGRFAGGWALVLAIAAAAWVLLWFSPQLVARSVAAFQAAPGRILLLGAAALVLTPGNGPAFVRDSARLVARSDRVRGLCVWRAALRPLRAAHRRVCPAGKARGRSWGRSCAGPPGQSDPGPAGRGCSGSGPAGAGAG